MVPFMKIETAPIKIGTNTPELSPARSLGPKQSFFAETIPLTMATKVVNPEGVLEKAKLILDSVPARFKLSKIREDEDKKRDFMQFRGRRGRGPCMGCLAGTEENHHGGSKCTRRGQRKGFGSFVPSIPKMQISKIDTSKKLKRSDFVFN